MSSTGETDKNGPKNAKPAGKPAANEHERPDPAAPGPNPPSESERAAAAKANPLRSPGEANHSDAQDGSADESQSDKDDDAKSSTSATGAAANRAPELRISASMLSAQPPADTAPHAPLPSGYKRGRRRVKRLARPVDPAVFNPISLLWPRATSRKGARIASRYGLTALIVALAWTLYEVDADTINKAVNFSSSAAAIAALVGAIAVLALIVTSYYFHSRIAALLSLVGVTALIVLQLRSPGGTSSLALASQAILVYMLLHGAYGTIAYHIYGRRKRRRSSKYRYKGR
ncbi:MAG TPA: hypothetical protein VM325_01030 [Alphaproteobacteria bacterium]|nr:hypothetical protein [Alphaproteobacteria bacterium]